LLITAALLHDIGKLWEMDHEWQQGTYTMEGALLGHIFLGAEQIGEICRELRFPPDLRIRLQHILLAHHDTLAFGSPVRPMLPEAIVIAKCDQISAELTACLDAARDRQPGQQVTWKGDRAFFVGNQNGRTTPLLPVITANDPEERLLQRLLTTVSRLPHAGVPCLRLPEDDEDFFGL
jgi:hypothetical protein